MRALIQRVRSASVRVDGESIAVIRAGLCCFVTHNDSAAATRRLAEPRSLRIFEDDEGRINRSAEELLLELLVVSQFTLYAGTTRGRRPSFVDAAGPEQAQSLVEALVATLVQLGARVATGRFGATMEVDLINDGPFTILLEV